MSTREVSSVVNALIIFVDIVDSSKFSSVLGFEEYASKLLEFQRLFKKLGEIYFKPAKSSDEYTEICARGDEGTIFCVDNINNEKSKADLIFKAIEFVLELKGNLYYRELVQINKSPKQMDVGAGIHYGEVATISEIKNESSIITGIEGFSINYAKRVESSSRMGKYSRIFLSQDAAKLLEGEPVILNKRASQMKGIEESTDVFEFRAGLFNEIPIKINSCENAELIEKVSELAEHPDNIKFPWLISFVISVLDSSIERAKIEELKHVYRKRQLFLAWNSVIENDPILLYIRAREYKEKGEFTQQLRILKEILEKHPEFVHAQKSLIQACWSVTKSKAERSEKIYARDVAKEYIEKFSDYLSEKEKENFKTILVEYKKQK